MTFGLVLTAKEVSGFKFTSAFVYVGKDYRVTFGHAQFALFEIEHNGGQVFVYTGNRGEFMGDVFKAHSSYGCPG